MAIMIKISQREPVRRLSTAEGMGRSEVALAVSKMNSDDISGNLSVASLSIDTGVD